MVLRSLFHFRLVITILIAYLCALAGCREINKQALIEDIHIYEAYVNEVHANPYRIISKEYFNAKTQQTIKEILKIDGTTISSSDCYFYLQEIAASIQDGHTSIYSPSYLFSSENSVLPLKLRYFDGSLYVTDNFNSEDVPKYSSILEINQITIEKLFEECTQIFHTSLDHVKWSLFEDYFPILLPKYLKMAPLWKVKYKLDSNVKVTELNAITLTEYNQTGPKHDNKYSNYSIFIQDEEIPVLKLPGFSYGKAESYQHFIDAYFDKHAESTYLVIDIRENRGGSGYWGFYLLDNLTSSDYQIAELFEFKVSELMRKSIYAGKAGSHLQNAKNGEYVKAVNRRMRTPHETPNKFKGKVFLLISEKTFSAGVVFAAVFKANGFGIIVGRETAGRISFGSDPITIKLPNTRLKGSLPSAIYILPGENPDRGVIPDIVVSQTIDDYRIGRDMEMDKIKVLIQEDIINKNRSD